MRILGFVLAATVLLGVVPTSHGIVSVAYAGSLVGVMEGPLKGAFERSTGIAFQGEGKGSKALANLIADGDITPDVFLSADSSLGRGLRVFGQADLVLGYAPTSRFAGRFEAVAAGKASLADVLRTAGLRLARTDPQLDPKGTKTLAAMKTLGVAPGGADQVFPEEELLTRVETGEADCGFFYSTEVNLAGIRSLRLPDGIGARSGIAVDYAIVALPGARHPGAARSFIAFLLDGAGRPILEHAGIRYRP